MWLSFFVNRFARQSCRVSRTSSHSWLQPTCRCNYSITMMLSGLSLFYPPCVRFPWNAPEGLLWNPRGLGKGGKNVEWAGSKWNRDPISLVSPLSGNWYLSRWNYTRRYEIQPPHRPLEPPFGGIHRYLFESLVPDRFSKSEIVVPTHSDGAAHQASSGQRNFPVSASCLLQVN